MRVRGAMEAGSARMATDALRAADRTVLIGFRRMESRLEPPGYTPGVVSLQTITYIVPRLRTQQPFLPFPSRNRVFRPENGHSPWLWPKKR